jgi:hypothetical protein
MQKSSRIALMLFLAASMAACSSDDKHGALQGGVPTSKSAMAPEALIFLPYAEADGQITQQGRDQAVAATWQKVSGGRDQLSLMQLRDALKSVEGGSAGFFSPLEFDPQGAGSVTRAKFAHALDVRFARLDRNGNGVLEPKERVPLPRNETFQPRSDDPEFGGGVYRGGDSGY